MGGIDTGEKENPDTPVTEKEKPEEEEEQKRKKIRICVFFDGTGNNKTNVEEREKNTEHYQYQKQKYGKDDNSYEADKTNVAKMDLYVGAKKPANYTNLIAIYIEGIGTDDRKKDSDIGYGSGMGGTGVKKKVDDGINSVLYELGEVLEEDDVIDELVLDVFGFSRGAAAARYFIHRVLKTKGGYLSKVHHVLEEKKALSPVNGALREGGLLLSTEPLARRIRNAGHTISNEDVRVEFVGLFDTVSSEAGSSSDVNSLQLDSLKHKKVKSVLHLVAADEHRGNFSYTNINSAGKKGTQIYLPGVHSDIGGGYRADMNGNPVEEELVLDESYHLGDLKKDRAYLLEEGWFKEDQVFIVSPPDAQVYPRGGFRPVHTLKSHRSGIDNSYTKIPLNIMVDFFRKKTEIPLDSKFEDDEKIPEHLTKAYEALKEYVKEKGSKDSEIEDWKNDKVKDKDKVWLKKIRNKYLHFSSHYNVTVKLYVPLKPHFPADKNGWRKRISYDG